MRKLPPKCRGLSSDGTLLPGIDPHQSVTMRVQEKANRGAGGLKFTVRCPECGRWYETNEQYQEVVTGAPRKLVLK